ncbi:hypothetical protein EW145_g1977 [Phellinidium pouzarii]|uniref:Xylanolytic transcriptional activator regulatory domain-containing protein n=1 Tax=Phellinidium pouzarii TaxID=167371 RepID=A0A4S4LD18_9AGAM|nr:hypothetical protein EW145_g1977 [Phellinidium pouzarii]
MSKRIRQLEDALHIAQASLAPTTHPLLSEELLMIKFGVEATIEKEPEYYPKDDDENDLTSDLSYALGTLAISEQGEARFMGRVASEALLIDVGHRIVKEVKPKGGVYNLPEQLTTADEAFPFAPAKLPKEELLKIVNAHMPSYARATALAEAYLGNIAWFCRIVQRTQIMEELLPTVYKPFHARTNPGKADSVDTEGGFQANDCTHRLALLLAVLACGAAGDLTLTLDNDEAELYVHLARAVLNLHPVFVGASLETVQTVLMLSAFQFHACRSASFESGWKLMTFGFTLATSIGLRKIFIDNDELKKSDVSAVDRDPARWEMEPKIIQRRRFLFWEIFTIDKWESLESGRPATFNLQEVDCEFPADTEATTTEDGTIIPSFWRWKHQFTKEILAMVAEHLCLAQPIKYSKILELDSKVRNFETHPTMFWSSLDSDDDMNTGLRRYMWGLFKEIALLFLHRNFFARAMLESPKKPLASPFAVSLLSAYASAITSLKAMRGYFEKHTQLLLRQWIIWTHALASGVIIGSFAVTRPSSAAASGALKELELTVKLFENATEHQVAKSGLPILTRLLEKARFVNRFNALPRYDPSSPGFLYTPSDDDPDAKEELKILCGTARFVDFSIKKSSSRLRSSPLPSLEHSNATPDSSTRSHSPLVPHAGRTSLFPDLPPSATVQLQPKNNVLGTSFEQVQSVEIGPQRGIGLNSAFLAGGNSTGPVSNYLVPDASIHLGAAASGRCSIPDDQGRGVRYDHVPGECTGIIPSSDAHSGSQVQEISLMDGLSAFPSGTASWSDSLSSDPATHLEDEMDIYSNLDYFMNNSGASYDPSIADAWRSIIEDAQLMDLGLDNIFQ